MTERQAYLIDSTARSIKPVTITDLAGLQALVGGYLELAYAWDNGDTLYVDEEGLLKNPQHFFWIAQERPDQPFAGNGVLVGREIGDTDVTAPPTMAIEQLRMKVNFAHLREIL